MGLPQQRQIHAKAAIGGLRSRNRLKHQIDRRALPDQGERRRHMGENAALRRNLQSGNDLVEQTQQAADHSRIVACRVDADAGIARSQQDAVQDRGGDAIGVIKGMIGLQPHAHPPAQPDCVAKAARYLAFLRNQDEILVAHQFRDRRGHFRRDPA